MTKRMKAMLAAMLVLGVLLALDRPAQPEVLEVSEAPPRKARAPAPLAARLAPLAAGAASDQAVPDLFAPPGAPSATPAAAAVGEADGEPPEPFVLIGFKDEEGVREAYLMRGEAVLVARAGTMLDQRFRVLALRQEAVHIKDQQTGATLRIGFEVTP